MLKFFIKIASLVFLLVLIFYTSQSSLIPFLVNNTAVSNMVDLIGNVLIAITSAIIAWFTTEYQLRNQKFQENERTRKINKVFLILIREEITFNLKLFDLAIETKNMAPVSKIQSTVWSDSIEGTELDDDIISKLYSYYRDLSIAKDGEYNNEFDQSIIESYVKESKNLLEQINKMLIKL